MGFGEARSSKLTALRSLTRATCNSQAQAGSTSWHLLTEKHRHARPWLPLGANVSLVNSNSAKGPPGSFNAADCPTSRGPRASVAALHWARADLRSDHNFDQGSHSRPRARP